MQNPGSALPILRRRSHEVRLDLDVQGEIQSVIYCQDCGATNDTSDRTCRICHHSLHRKSSTIPCANCQDLLGENPLFCAHCGTPVPLLMEAAARSEQRVLANAAGGDPPSSARRVRAIPPGTHSAGDSASPRGGPTAGRGESRDTTKDAASFISEQDLPTWLRQVIAAEAAESEAEARRTADEEAKRARRQRETAPAQAIRVAPEPPPRHERSAPELAKDPEAPAGPVVSQQDIARRETEIVASPAQPRESKPQDDEDQHGEAAPTPSVTKLQKAQRARPLQAEAKASALTKQGLPKIRRSDPRLETTSHRGNNLLLIGSLLLIGIALVMLLAPILFG